MSDSNLPNPGNPFHDRPDSQEYKKFEERMQRLADKQAALIPSTSSGAVTGGDKALDSKEYRRDFNPNAKGRDAIFLFPESYNQLRKELHDYWPNLWAIVSWRMANRAEEFIEQMNEALDMRIVFDTDKVDWISQQYLFKLRELRSISQLPVTLLDVTNKEETGDLNGNN